MVIPNANVECSLSCWMRSSVWTPQSTHPKPDDLLILQILKLFWVFLSQKSLPLRQITERMIYICTCGWWITLRDKVASTLWGWFC